MKDAISPKYIINLIRKIEKELQNQFNDLRTIQFYIERWQNTDIFPFTIHKTAYGSIDILETLNNMDDETLVKIAIDLGIETPGFIPSVPTFKNVLKEEYKSVYDVFEKAIKKVIKEPDIAIGLANSALESLIKEILRKIGIDKSKIEKMTLEELTKTILKEYKMFPKKDIPAEITIIGSSLLKIAKNIEGVRSSKTCFHGKTEDDYKIKDPLYAYFIINATATLGIFFDSFYKSIISEDNEDEEKYPWNKN